MNGRGGRKPVTRALIDGELKYYDIALLSHIKPPEGFKFIGEGKIAEWDGQAVADDGNIYTFYVRKGK